jgi:hypothetical protein
LQVAELQRLAQVIFGALAHRGNGHFNGDEGGHENDEGIQVARLHFVEQGHAVQVGHLDVAEDQVGQLLIQERQRFVAAARDRHLITEARQKLLQHVTKAGVVFDDHDFALWLRHVRLPSNRIARSERSPMRLQTRPWWRQVILWQSVRRHVVSFPPESCRNALQ